MKFLRTLIICLVSVSAFQAQPIAAQWEETSLTNTTIFSLLSTSDRIYATSHSEVYWTTDNGDNWSSSGSGLESANGIYTLAQSGNVFFAGANNGIYRSTDNCLTWNELTFSGSYIRAVAVKGSYIYAGFSGGVRRSNDQGDSWIATSGLSGSVYYLHVVGDYVFVGTYDGGVSKLLGNDLTWATANNGLTDLQIRGIASNGSDLFVGTSSDGIFRSTDYGVSWEPVNNGIPTVGLINNALFANSGVLLAATYTGVFISTNNGDSWSAFNDGLSSAMECIAANDSWYFAGDYDVWRRSLSDVSAVLPNEERIRMSCYPNPATDVLYITGDFDGLDIDEIQVLSLDGRFMKRLPWIENRSLTRLTVNVSELPNGCYLLKLSSRSSVATVMFAKND